MANFTNPGFVTWTPRPDISGGAVSELTNFGRGFAIRIVAGGQYVKRIRVRSGGDFWSFDELEYFDGKIMPVPTGFDRIVLEWQEDTVANAHRAVFEIATLPYAVWAATDGRGAQSSRIVFDHIFNSAVAPTLAAGEILEVCDVKPGDFYQGPEGVQSGNVAVPTYPTRTHGTNRPRWYPTSGLYFDGYVSGSNAACPLAIWVYAYQFTHNNATPQLHFYWRELNNETEPGSPPVLGQLGVVTQQLSEGTSKFPVPIPADGFKLLVENTGAAATTIRGIIGGRSS